MHHGPANGSGADRGARAGGGGRMNLLLPPPLVVALLAAAMWGLDRAFPAGRLAFAGQKPLAIALFVLACALMAAAVISFASARTTINPLRPANATRLITGSVFRYSRNPIYLADLLLLAAWAVWLGHAGNVVWLVVFVVYINRFQIRPEEAALTNLFGAEYAAYCARVRRWL